MSILYDYEPDSVEAQNAAVPSPCIGICKMDAEQGWCSGCFRNIDELRDWSSASDASKRSVWRQIKERMFVDAS